jgi:hypothetical protein
LFRIRVKKCVDDNLPLQYQYFLYPSEDHHKHDIFVGSNQLKVTLTDRTSINDINLILPSPRTIYGNAAESVILIISVIDSIGGVSNSTIPVKITSLQGYIDKGHDFSSLVKKIDNAIT